MISNTAKASALAMAAAITATGIVVPAAMAQEHWMEKIGHRWDVQENGWTGVWSRRTYRTTRSNIYDAVWTHPNHRNITAELRITLSVRNEVTILRKDTSGTPNSCTYRGYLSSNGVDAWGTHTCTITGATVHRWTAKVRR